MERKTEAEKAAEEYGDTLSELNSISKVEINALTMLAEDSKEYAIQIAACIEDHLRTASSKKKLPVLYLIDSICKNFPKSKYVELFTQNIVSNFCNVFEVSPEKTRKSLHKLRMTWDTTKTFPPKKLNAIDERVHQMDPNWPVLHKITAAQVQVQAKQKKQHQQNQPQQQQQQQPQQSNQQVQQGLKQSGSADEDTVRMNGARNRQPKSRAARRLRNDNNANRVNNNNTSIPDPSQPVPGPIIDGIAPIQPQTPLLVPGQQPISQLTLYPPHLHQQPTILQQQTPQPASQLPTSQQQSFEGMYQLQAQYQSQSVFPQQPLQPLTQNSPLATLDQGSFLGAPNFPQTISQNFPQLLQQITVDNRQNQHSHPTLPDDLDITLESIYGGKQCSNCSLRFDDNNKYAIHLDWHFRQNLKSDNMFARRKWYYPLNLWVQFREINDDEIQESNNSDSTHVNDLLISHNDHEVPTAPTSKEDEKNICSVCHETFEKFWAEEEEEWRLRNARLHDDQRVYHPLCLMDMLQANPVQQ